MADGFEGLEVWQKAHALMLFVHQRIHPAYRLMRNGIWRHRFVVRQRVLART
jgi:hypothetical protein